MDTRELCLDELLHDLVTAGERTTVPLVLCRQVDEPGSGGRWQRWRVMRVACVMVVAAMRAAVTRRLGVVRVRMVMMTDLVVMVIVRVMSRG